MSSHGSRTFKFSKPSLDNISMPQIFSNISRKFSTPLLDNMSMSELVAKLCVTLSIVHIICMSTLGSHIQTKVYFTCAVICFTTTVVGVMMNNSLASINTSFIPVGMNLLLIATAIIPQMMYLHVVSKNSEKITKLKTRLEYHDGIATISTMTMCLCLFAFLKWNAHDHKFFAAITAVCVILFIIACVLIRITEKNLQKDNDNSQK